MVGLNKKACLVVMIVMVVVSLFSYLCVYCPARTFTTWNLSSIKLKARNLSFEERVKYQTAIEQVYWNHRLWPNSISNKPSLEKALSTAEIESKVRDHLQVSTYLKNAGQAVTLDQLQEELSRIARSTRQPEVLNELYESLDNDPFLIAECLARPLLEDRIMTARTNLQYHNLGSNQRLREASPIRRVMPIVFANPSLSNSTEDFSAFEPASQASNCARNTWRNTNLSGAPGHRIAHIAVWTGSEMIVWGGYYNGAFFGDGARYDPATDSWSSMTASGALSPRRYHVAVWDGFELIVWGGTSSTNQFNRNGARYNPTTNSWTPTNDNGAPAGRYAHTAVWTGNEMIVWGGNDGNGLVNTGARYNPTNDSWHSMSTAGAPEGRRYHTAVWTGSEMIVWGGEGSTQLNTGGKYNPQTDSWTATTTQGAPEPRDSHTAIFTGSEMIVWGGSNSNYPYYLNTGARYSPTGNFWLPMTSADAPSARSDHSAIWTGTEMVLWGGAYLTGTLNTGAKYSPSTNTWEALPTSAAPAARYFHTAVWTGNEMVIFGGGTDSPGGRFCDSASAAQCTYDVSPLTLQFPPSGGFGTAVITTGDTCGWSAVSNASWITIQSRATGTGTREVNYAVAANSTASPRSGTLTVAGKTILVTENSSSASCSYAISPISAVIESTGGSSTVQVSSPSGCGWTATSNVSWITINSGSGTGNGTVTYTVASNPNPSARKAKLTIGGQKFPIKQRGN
jgi:N-acetylneuraminic acid mutarotase